VRRGTKLLPHPLCPPLSLFSLLAHLLGEVVVDDGRLAAEVAAAVDVLLPLLVLVLLRRGLVRGLVDGVDVEGLGAARVEEDCAADVGDHNVPRVHGPGRRHEVREHRVRDEDVVLARLCELLEDGVLDRAHDLDLLVGEGSQLERLLARHAVKVLVVRVEGPHPPDVLRLRRGRLQLVELREVVELELVPVDADPHGALAERAGPRPAPVLHPPGAGELVVALVEGRALHLVHLPVLPPADVGGPAAAPAAHAAARAAGLVPRVPARRLGGVDGDEGAVAGLVERAREVHVLLEAAAELAACKGGREKGARARGEGGREKGGG
jgi:hypothetical protein